MVLMYQRESIVKNVNVIVKNELKPKQFTQKDFYKMLLNERDVVRKKFLANYYNFLVAITVNDTPTLSTQVSWHSAGTQSSFLNYL